MFKIPWKKVDCKKLEALSIRKLLNASDEIMVALLSAECRLVYCNLLLEFLKFVKVKTYTCDIQKWLYYT
jgi:hypothetical protein